MTRAADTVEKAARTGFLAVRRGVDRAKQAGAEAATVAEQKLTERGMAPQQLAEALAEGADVARKEAAKTTRRTRKKLAAKAKVTRKDLAKAAAKARKNAGRKAGRARKKAAKSDIATYAMTTVKQLKADAKAAAADAKKAKKGSRKRRWPWVVGLAAVAAGAAYALRSKPEPVPAPKPAPKPAEAQESAAQRNGQHVPAKPVSEKKN
jgi:hypothetical protein